MKIADVIRIVENNITESEKKVDKPYWFGVHTTLSAVLDLLKQIN